MSSSFAGVALDSESGSMAGDAPFFIIGSGRCGSTLLRLMLCAHSRIHIPPETWFIADLVHEISSATSLAPAQVDRALAIMINNYRWPDMQIAAEEFRRRAHALAAPKLVDVINLVYHHHLQLHG
jgi:Sulfotransferase family